MFEDNMSRYADILNYFMILFPVLADFRIWMPVETGYPV